MRLIIEGGQPLVGEVSVPADKSISHRAFMLAALAEGTSEIVARDIGDDVLSTVRVLRGLGVRIEAREPGRWIVEGHGPKALRSSVDDLDCGNSGSTMRMMAGICAGAGLAARLIGDESLMRRPMGRICRPLRTLGASVGGHTEDDRELPPLCIRRASDAPDSLEGFRGGHVDLEIASAQVKSSLLLAGIASGRAVSVRAPFASRDHTERMLRARGVTVTTAHERGEEVTVGLDGCARVAACDSAVPGDFSSAAFLLAASTLVPGSRVVLTNVGVNASRTGLLEILEEYGAKTLVTEWREQGGEPVATLTAQAGGLVARRAGGGPLRVEGASIPSIIDELVVLAAIAAVAQGETVVSDAHELRVKESDRIKETVRLLEAFGVRAEQGASGYCVLGPQALRPARVDVSSDHRIAMTAAVLALAAPGTSVIDGFEISSISYPGFIAALEELGAKVKTEGA